MKKKKVLSSLLVAAMATSLLAGCGSSDKAPATDSTPADNTAASNTTDTPAEQTPQDTGTPRQRSRNRP